MAMLYVGIVRLSCVSEFKRILLDLLCLDNELHNKESDNKWKSQEETRQSFADTNCAGFFSIFSD